MPIRISANAFGHDRPSRDLLVSPGHAICIDLIGEVLIPASALVNGTTIMQLDVERITFWHVELESHDVILAENLPCESYLEMGNRAFFTEAQTTVLQASPETTIAAHDEFCRPFHANGPAVDFVRQRLALRSCKLGWRLEDEPLADMHLVADGTRIDAVVQGRSAIFVLPGEPNEVWLASKTTVPAQVDAGADLRTLGVCVSALSVHDASGEERTIFADDPLLRVGFHACEEGPMRWTNGRARLPAALWARCPGAFSLRVDLAHLALPRWTRTTCEGSDPAWLAYAG